MNELWNDKFFGIKRILAPLRVIVPAAGLVWGMANWEKNDPDLFKVPYLSISASCNPVADAKHLVNIRLSSPGRRFFREDLTVAVFSEGASVMVQTVFWRDNQFFFKKDGVGLTPAVLGQVMVVSGANGPRDVMVFQGGHLKAFDLKVNPPLAEVHIDDLTC